MMFRKPLKPITTSTDGELQQVINLRSDIPSESRMLHDLVDQQVFNERAFGSWLICLLLFSALVNVIKYYIYDNQKNEQFPLGRCRQDQLGLFYELKNNMERASMLTLVMTLAALMWAIKVIITFKAHQYLHMNELPLSSNLTLHPAIDAEKRINHHLKLNQRATRELDDYLTFASLTSQPDSYFYFLRYGESENLKIIGTGENLMNLILKMAKEDDMGEVKKYVPAIQPKF